MGRGSFLELNSPPAGPALLEEQNPTERDEIFCLERGAKCMYAAAYEPALRFYSRALGRSLQLEDAWLGQCLALIDLGEFGEAVTWAQRALEHCPGSGPCFAARAVGLCRQGMLEKALGFLDTAFKSRMDHWFIWLARGEVLTAMDKQINATHCINKSLEVGGAPRWWIMRRAGEMLLIHDRPGEALNYFNRTLDLESGLAVNFLRAAQANKVMGRKQEAAKFVEQALTIDPDHAETRKFKEGLGRVDPIGWLAARLGKRR